MIREIFKIPEDGPYTKAVVFMIWLMISVNIIGISVLVLEVIWSSLKYKLLRDIKNMLSVVKVWVDTAKAYRQEARNIHEKTSEKMDTVKQVVEEVKQVVESNVKP